MYSGENGESGENRERGRAERTGRAERSNEYHYLYANIPLPNGTFDHSLPVVGGAS
jgi:hypothetical protein